MKTQRLQCVSKDSVYFVICLEMYPCTEDFLWPMYLAYEFQLQINIWSSIIFVLLHDDISSLHYG